MSDIIDEIRNKNDDIISKYESLLNTAFSQIDESIKIIENDKAHIEMINKIVAKQKEIIELQKEEIQKLNNIISFMRGN